MSKKTYSITDDQKKRFASTYLLNYIINKPKSFSVLLEDNDVDLEEILEYMMLNELIKIEDKKNIYIPTEKGRDALVNFTNRYYDFLKNFDIFCAVDLGEGVFAFEEILNYKDNEAGWNKYLAKDYWEDLRIAVAEFKKLDPVEIVFMSSINERTYGKSDSGWQFDLLLGTVWDDIADICNNALKADDLSYEDDEGFVDGKEVLQDVISQAAELNLELMKQADEIDAEEEANMIYDDDDDDDDDDEYVDRVVVETIHDDVYYGYRDPFYISPIWLVPIFLF